MDTESEGNAMKIFGMNKKACKGLWVAYVVVNRHKYFIGAYRTREKAQEIATKYDGDYTYIER
jgi:hypothetical protein